MANRNNRNIQVEDFRLKATPTLGTGAVARPDGSDTATTARALGGIAEATGQWADRAAAREGKAAGDVAGNDPNFRPSGLPTIRGQAMDEAGTSTYLNNLDAKLRQSMTAAYQEHQNDPTALNAAFGAIKAQMADPEKGDVWPELAGQFNGQFERLRLPFQIKALDNFQGIQRDAARATAVMAQSAGETVREQAIRAAPTSEATRQAVEATLAEDDVRDQRLVKSEALTAEQAAKSRIKRRQDAEVTIVDGTADALPSAEAVATYRETFRKEFTGGKTKFDADGYERADALLAQKEQQLRARGNQGRETLQRELRRVADQYADGVPSSPDQVAALKQKAATVTGGDELVADFDRRIVIGGLVRTRTPAQLDAMADATLASARADKRGLTSDEGERVQFLRSKAEEKRKALATDPLAHARQHGLVEAPPLAIPDRETGEAVANQMPARIAAARAASSVQGGETRYLTADDKRELKSVFDRGGERALQAVQGLVRGAGADAPAILREIGGEAPELAKVGDLIVGGGPGAETAAREITRALDLRRMTGEGAKGASVPTLPKTAPALMQKEFGGAYLNSPTAQAQLMAGAKAIYESRAFGRISDPNSSEAETLYQESLRAAAGEGKQGDVSYGGVTKYKPGWWTGYHVAIPANVQTDRFRDVVGAIRDDDLGGATDPAGKPITARDVRGAIPVRVKGGYAFSLDDPKDANPRFLGKPGAPLILNFEQLAPELRKRVPGAFLGGDK